MSKLAIPPMPEGLTWTGDQWKAIMAKDRDILVAAAAGSGKTAVLVERIIQKILDTAEPVNVDELLVVTFTSASAAEMRHRIGEALETAIDQDPGSKHLLRQLSLLNKASISTLHAFCMEVIRKYYYMIDLDPGFRIADDTESQLLMDEVMDELFETEYGKEGNEAFFHLVDTFTNDRSDDALQEIVRDIYNFARSNPLPEKYLQSMVAMYDVEQVTQMEDLPFIGVLMLDIELQLDAAREMIEKALEISKLPGGPSPRVETYLDDLAVIDTLIQAKGDSWNTLYQAMQAWSFSRAKSVRGDEYDKALTEKAQKLRDAAKKKIQKLKDELFSRKPEGFLQDMKKMKPVIQTLAGLVQSFAERFAEAKRDKGLVDYSDLEHYCLKILIGEITAEGEILPSEAAVNYRNTFKEVFVDEYQDTNMVQETILKLVSKTGEDNGNLFMVGDVKQSIYRFRLAEPNLFLDKYNQFTTDGETAGLRIDLARNFRSREEVLDGTNFLFKQIMGVKVGEIEYDEAAELRTGADYPASQDHPVELLLIDQDTGDQETAEAEMEDISGQAELDAVDLEKSQLEARVITSKIRELIGGRAPVYNPKTKSTRPVEYRDIVILLRSMAWAPQIMEELKQQGIPVYANLSTGYFAATEVSIMLSLLRVIDNPVQDIPLASVLRSPIVGLNEEEMAKIRIHQQRGSFWDAVSRFCDEKPTKEEEEIYEKVRAFVDRLVGWRTMARQGSLSELIWQLYRDTQFYDFAGGLPGGKQRQANLRALYDRARQYEETSFRGLFRFLRFVERMMERGDDLGAARALGEQEDVVRIMTIHSSKGLEFPVVFIAGLARNFNMKDLYKSYLLDKEYGFAAKYIDVDKRIAYPSLPQMAFKRKKRMEMLAEEMRVLYVALTRAKEKLYLLGTLKDLAKQIEQWQESAGNPEWLLKDYKRASATCFLDWIGPALTRHKTFGEWTAASDDSSPLIPEEISSHPSAWKIIGIKAADIKSQEITEPAAEDGLMKLVGETLPVPVHSSLEDEVQARLSWKYPHPEAARHRSKQSVSEIKRQREISDAYSGTEIIRKFKKSVLTRPRFMQEKSLSPAERGTAMHMVMQHVDLRQEVSAKQIEDQITWMIERELLTAEQAQVIEPELIGQFFAADIGKRMIHARKVYREVPFTLTLHASEVYTDWHEEDEPIFVQGIIDCLFEDEQGLVLIDYKSDGIHDRFKGGFEQAKPILEERYKVQIDLYTKAVEKIWRRKVDERYLFFFDGAHFLRLDH